MRPNDPVISLSGTWLRETEKAVQFAVHTVSGYKLQNPVTTWFPFSQTVKSTKNPNVLNSDTLIVSQWIWRQKIDQMSELSEQLEDADPLDDGNDSEQSYGELDGNPNF